jgi:oxalate decarboxylase/phosphoglucose isomerase-like protein (cupin superfamily)
VTLSNPNPIDPASVPTQTFDWGAIKWFVTSTTTPGAGITFGEVVVLPGGGHGRHNHPDAEELLYVISGEGEQMVDDGEPFPIRAGDTIYIPLGIYHSTLNTGWTPLRVLALYNPGGPELALSGLPDFRELPEGEVPAWVRT